MKICHLSSGHPPDDDRIFYKEARSLARRYSTVVVVGPYPERTPKDPDGVQILTFRRQSGLLGRFRAIQQLYGIGLVCRADVYHCHEPEALVAALLIKRRRNVTVVFDSHELWGAALAEKLHARGLMERWIISAYQVFERRLLARCDFAIGPSWAVADYLSSVLGEDRVEMIANAPVAGVFSEGSRPEWAEKTILCHDGFLSDDRGMKVMLEAVRRVRQKHDIEFRVIGDAVGADKEWLNDFIRDHALENTVRITGWLPYTSVGEQLRCCHIGLIGYRRSAHKRIVFSNKVLNYMYYGLPFVAPDFVLSKQRLLREERCCILADSDSPEAYAGAICYLIEHRTEAQEMSTNALRASREKYRWEHMEPRLFGLYERITGGQIGAGAAQAHAGAV